MKLTNWIEFSQANPLFDLIRLFWKLGILKEVEVPPYNQFGHEGNSPTLLEALVGFFNFPMCHLHNFQLHIHIPTYLIQSAKSSKLF